MNKRKQATLQTLLLIGYTEVLNKARKGVKGLRTQHLFSIQLLGQYPEGLSLSEAGQITNSLPQTIYNRFGRAMFQGFLTKQGTKYYLSDKGRQVYDQMTAAFSSTREQIIKILAEEAKKRV